MSSGAALSGGSSGEEAAPCKPGRPADAPDVRAAKIVAREAVAERAEEGARSEGSGGDGGGALAAGEGASREKGVSRGQRALMVLIIGGELTRAAQRDTH